MQCAILLLVKIRKVNFMPLFDSIEEFQNVSPVLQWAMFIVGVLIAIVALVSVGVSIWLAIKYIVYNRRTNSANLTGNEAARKILDANGLQHIKVSTFGSLLFGNSYSHYFKKVRIRRLTNKKPSITSLAIGAEKASLAVLDKERDPDMVTRVKLTPFIYFGPLAFIPIVAVGVIVDIILFNFTGVATLIAAGAGILFYVISLVLSIKVLKTEVKAQQKAIEIMAEQNMATNEELEMMKELYKIYNIQYVNDIIMEFLQLIMRVLQFIAKAQQTFSSNND